MKLSKMLLGATALAAMVSLCGVANATTTLSGSMTADNAFFAYLGADAGSLGALVDSGNAWWQSFSLTPTALTPGVTNYLNIEAINYGGPGGLNFSLSLSNAGFHFANGSQTLTSADISDITATYNNGNSDVSVQPWVAATGAAAADSGYPWGSVAGGGTWVDAASAQSLNACGYCTVDFTVAIGSAAPEASTWAMLLLGFGALGFAGYRSQRKGAAYAL